jgi:small GTP-binding protein
MTACYIVKVGIVGNYNVGKTSFLNSFIEKESINSQITTIGVDFRYMLYKFKDIEFKLQIWDTAGQEQYANIVRSYLKEIDIVIFMFDITSMLSFKKLDKWITEVEYFNKDKNIIKYIVANKKDLEKHREVNYNIIKKYCNQKNINFSESSIKDIDSINVVFENIIEELYINLITKKIDLKLFYKIKDEIKKPIENDKQKCCNYL